MKFLYPLLVAILLGACAFTPEDKEAAHQRKLWQEARANFIALGGHEGSQQPQATPAPPAPQPRTLSFPQSPSSGVTQSAPTPAPHHWFAFPSKPAPSRPMPPPAPARNPDDTVYYWQVPPPGRAASSREQVAEVKYARTLAKRPEELTPEERLYAHEHY